MSVQWSWAGARATGLSHVQAGTGCQDAFACVTWPSPSEPETLIAVVADGAGSAARADAGAETVTECFVDTVSDVLNEADGASFDAVAAVRRGIEQARLMIALQALEEGRKNSDFACTIVGCLIHREAAVFGQIGDGAAVYALQDEPCAWQAAVWPDHGEFINTTTFVTCASAFDRLRLVAIACPVAHVCLFSDGLERLVLDFRKRQPHGPFFDRMVSSLTGFGSAGQVPAFDKQLCSLLSSSNVRQRTDDDTSIIVASLRHDRQEPQWPPLY